MITVKRSFLKIISFDERYFVTTLIWSDAFRIVSYFNTTYKLKALLLAKSKKTVIINLQDELDTIFGKFSSTNKNEIRRSEKDGIVCQQLTNIDEFITFFNEFAKKKKINTLDINRIKSYGLENLYIFGALQDNRLLSAHSYLVDKNASVALLLTSSSARFEDTTERQIIGRANKQLHYYELKKFKELGISTYDFGGIATNKDIEKNQGLKGVNDFKLSFGGNKVEFKEYSSFLYILFKFLANRIGLVNSNSSLQKKIKL
jgi:hypothetical protein